MTIWRLRRTTLQGRLLYDAVARKEEASEVFLQYASGFVIFYP